MSTTNERSVFGKIAKILFIAFNVVMLGWALSILASPNSGTAMFAELGWLIVFGCWAAGAAVLGLITYLTRAK